MYVYIVNVDIYVNIKLKPETSGKFHYTIFTPDLYNYTIDTDNYIWNFKLNI